MAIYRRSGLLLSAAYSLDGSPVSKAYDVNGELVFDETVVDYSNFTKSAFCSASVSNMQGFDIYGATIFQFRGQGTTIKDKMLTIAAQSGTIIGNNITAKSDHGDSASFSSVKYEPTDAFPLLYVTADTNPCKVYVNRVTATSSQLIRTLLFPLEQAGYYGAHAYDESRQVMYIVGYTEENYQTDDGGNNKTRVSLWDMSDMTDNGDNTFTPRFISNYDRPFIYTMQGQQFHDGLIWIASGGTGTSQYIYALDPEDGTQCFKIDLETTTEVEGLAFISSTEMVVGFQGGTYTKYTFATV